MKKILAVATIGVVGYLVVKKIKEMKNKVEVNEEGNDIIEEVVGKVINDNIEGVAEANNKDNDEKDIVMIAIELTLNICVICLGCKFYKLMINVGIVKGCKIMLEKLAAYIIATLGIRVFRYLALGK